MKPVIFEYDDFRKFLKESYSFLKKTRPAFSYRFFSRKAGFVSPNVLKLVMDGKRGLSGESIPKFAAALGLNKQESEFFSHLVGFNQALSSEEKARYFSRMSHSRRYREIRGLEKDQFNFYSKWYYSAVRELVTRDDFQENPDWIAKELIPAITPRQAKSAVALLMKLGLLTRGEDGRLEQADATISSGPEVRSLAVMGFHKEMLDRATGSLESVPAEERDISSVTLGVPKHKIAEIKEKVSQFRRDLLVSIGNSGEPTDRVYQLNIQIFPLTKKRGG